MGTCTADGRCSFRLCWASNSALSQVTVTSPAVPNEVPALGSLSFLPGCTGASYHTPTDYLGVSLNPAGSTKSFRESCSKVAASGSKGTGNDTKGPLELPFPSPRWFPPLHGAHPACSLAMKPSHVGLTPQSSVGGAQTEDNRWN